MNSLKLNLNKHLACVVAKIVVAVASVVVVVVWVKAVALGFNLIQLGVAKTLLICLFDNLYVHMLLPFFILMILALQAGAIEVAAVVIVVVNLAVTVVLVAVRTYCPLVKFAFKHSQKVPT